MNKLIIVAALILCGCRTKKEITHHTMAEHLSDTVFQYRDRTMRDTLIKVDARQIHDTLSLTDTIVRYVQGKGITLKVQKRPDGRIAVYGNCDSLMLLVQNLKVQRDSFSTKQARAVSELNDIKTQTSTSWLANILGYAGIATACLLIGFVAGKLIKI